MSRRRAVPGPSLGESGSLAAADPARSRGGRDEASTPSRVQRSWGGRTPGMADTDQAPMRSGVAPRSLAVEGGPLWAALSGLREEGEGTGPRPLMSPTARLFSPASPLPLALWPHTASGPVDPTPGVPSQNPRPGSPAAGLWLLSAAGPVSHTLQHQDDSLTGENPVPPFPPTPSSPQALCQRGTLQGSFTFARGRRLGLISSWGNTAFRVLSLSLPLSPYPDPLALRHLALASPWGSRRLRPHLPVRSI